MKIKIKDIKINSRIREDFGDLDLLKKSIEKYGLFNPILITQNYELISGERRLKVCQIMGLEEIEAKIINVKNNKEKLEIEGEENFLRKDFTKLEIEKIINVKRKLTKQKFNYIFSFIFKPLIYIIKIFTKKSI